MSYVGLVSEAEAGPELKPLYQQVRESFGFLPNYFQALGRAPRVAAGHPSASLRASMALGAALQEEGALPAALKEQILLVVSGLNTSSYCIAIHMEVLRKLGVEKPLGRALATNYASAPVGDKEKALFRFADKLTRKPSDVEQADIEAVRQAGWDEAALFETVLMVAWANFINRVSIGLGLVAEW